MGRIRGLGAVAIVVAWTMGCDWEFKTNVPDGDAGGSEDGGGEWRTFFVGDAHVYDPACGVPDFHYCTEAYACDVNGQDIAFKLQTLQWQGLISDNDLHEHLMWKEAGAPPQDGLDFQFADNYNVAWYLGHSNVGYISFSQPHAGDPWASPCVLGGVQVSLGIQTFKGPHTGKGGDASVFVNLGSCGGYYANGYDTECMEKNWYNDVRQTLAFAGSPVVARLQVTDFIECLEMGKDNVSAWMDVMRINHEEPFKENNPVVYTYAAAGELGGTEIGTIADNANILTGEWVTPPLPSPMNVMAISAHTGDQNLGNVSGCAPASAPLACQ